MSYITKSVTIVITLLLFLSECGSSDSYYIKQYSRIVHLKQGQLQGTVVELKEGLKRTLPPVEQYLGIPYAAPPVGDLRFMPSGMAPSWFGIKLADSFGPVCPQKFPDEATMSNDRKEYFLRLKKYLLNESEDCLYLNIYAPFQDPERSFRKYPVMVFIHGESFEWNSGNPYDGTVLAAYGKVIVVTLNFRLGILGFLKAGTEEHSYTSNFGLVDQIAALLWVKENIEAFGGDAGSVTLFGHGTGAVSASLLMLSPIVQQEENQMLFQRAILMGGTALSDWALAGNARDVTYQVAQELNCQIQDDFAACLRRKRLDDLMSASAKTPNYTTRFGPIVDSLVVPNDPKKSMSQYSDIFRRFELMYGVSQLESIHLLGPVALAHGMLEKERDQELRNYLRIRCEMKPELCLMRTLANYTQNVEFTQNDEKYGIASGHEPDRASLARDALLDILSDARTVAPVVQTAKYHSLLNSQSYFYVFTHKTVTKEYIRNMSYSGDELPYVFGVPLDGPKFHFVDQYTKHERLFSEIIMTYFCNFAYTGNPNVPRKTEYLTLGRREWIVFDREWPEFDNDQQRYLQLDTPPRIASYYRDDKMEYWNEVFPHITDNKTLPPPILPAPISTAYPPRRFPPRGNPPPWILFPPSNLPSGPPKKTTLSDRFENFYKPYETPKDGYTIKYFGEERPNNIIDNTSFGTLKFESPLDKPENSVEYGSVRQSISGESIREGSAMNTLIIIGSIFLLVNLVLFVALYYRCYRIKKVNVPKTEEHIDVDDEKPRNNIDDTYMVNGCNIVKMMSKSSKSDDTYDAVKPESYSSKFKLSRQMSNSTIDAHTKVRDWITSEIVYKYSPRFFRSRHPNSKKFQVPTTEDTVIEVESTKLDKNSTLGKSPTRPVSPTGESMQTLIPLNNLSKPKPGKPEKVSVAIDATPSGRGPSVLMQQPIELTKSLDYAMSPPEIEQPLRRSITLEDFSPRVIDSNNRKEIRKSTTSINLKYTPDIEPTIIKIEHNHSKSEPVQDFYSTMKKLRTFDPNYDINVTCRDENEKQHIPLTPAESLMTIKRRNFPKVLPDYPGKDALAQKRMSMPAHSLFMPIPEVSSFSQPNSPNKGAGKIPPAPPPRISTLGRQGSTSSNILPSLPVCLSEPKLAEEPPSSPEPEITCNNLVVGPLIPKDKKDKLLSETNNDNLLNTHPIYESLNKINTVTEKTSPQAAKTIITANPNCPIKRQDPKIVVKPSMHRKNSNENKNIPRVVVPDNQPLLLKKLPSFESPKEESDPEKLLTEKTEIPEESIESIIEDSMQNAGSSSKGRPKRSQIPTLVKNSNTSLNKESSSSESTPSSEESDTGTVVKRI